ncbi:MAG: hypothetical protein AB7O21_05105 [Gammaproteobacteria bacterium]
MNAVRILLAVGLILNGAWMIADPALWYAHIPGVRDTGPLNAHLARDVGVAYLVAGGGLAAAALIGPRWRPAAWTGVAFLFGHGLVHLGEALADVASLGHLLRDAPAVLGVPLAAAWSLRQSVRRENHAC